MKKFLILLALLPALAFGHGAPVFFSGTTVKWIPTALQSAGVCKLDSSGIMTSGDADLTSDVTGVLPMANGGTNKNMTAVNGGLLYSDADSVEVTAAGTSGQAVLSGGAGAPTFFAPTSGSVIVASTGGILSEDNANLFWDEVNNRLGISETTPTYKLHIQATADDYFHGVAIENNNAGSANALWNLYTDRAGPFTIRNPNQAVSPLNLSHLGNVSLAAGALNTSRTLNLKNITGETGDVTFAMTKIGSQTADLLAVYDTDDSTVLAKVNSSGAGTFAGMTVSTLGAGVAHLDSSGVMSSSAIVSADITDGTIVNDDVNASAAIAHSKMAALSTSLAMATDGSGVATTVAGVTATELGYVGDVTSAIQAQLDGKEPSFTTLPVADGGTGQSTYTDGQLLIGNSTGNTLTKSTLTAGSNITITNGGGSITIAASGGTSALSVATKTTDYTMTNSDDVILCNTTTSMQVTMHSALSATTKSYKIKNIGSGDCSVYAPQGFDRSGETTASIPAGGLPSSGFSLIPDFGGPSWLIF